MLFPGGQVALRTAENKTNSVYICTPGWNSRCPMWAGSQKSPKKGRNSQKKKCNTIQERFRMPHLAPICAQIQSEQQQWSSNRGCRAAPRDRWQRVTQRAGTAFPELLLPSTWQISAVFPLRESSGPGMSSGDAGKARVVVWIPGCAIHSMIQPRIFCELHEGKLPGRDGVTISVSVQEGSGYGHGDVDLGWPWPCWADAWTEGSWRSLPALVTLCSDLGTNNQTEGMQWGWPKEINSFLTVLIPNCRWGCFPQQTELLL